MCLFRRCSIRDYDPKTRRIWASGMIALSAEIVPTFFVSEFVQRHHALTLEVRSFFLAIAIVCFVWTSRRMHRVHPSVR